MALIMSIVTAALLASMVSAFTVVWLFKDRTTKPENRNGAPWATSSEEVLIAKLDGLRIGTVFATLNLKLDILKEEIESLKQIPQEADQGALDQDFSEQTMELFGTMVLGDQNDPRKALEFLRQEIDSSFEENKRSMLSTFEDNVKTLQWIAGLLEKRESGIEAEIQRRMDQQQEGLLGWEERLRSGQESIEALQAVLEHDQEKLQESWKELKKGWEELEESRDNRDEPSGLIYLNTLDAPPKEPEAPKEPENPFLGVSQVGDPFADLFEGSDELPPEIPGVSKRSATPTSSSVPRIALSGTPPAARPRTNSSPRYDPSSVVAQPSSEVDEGWTDLGDIEIGEVEIPDFNPATPHE